MRPCCGPLFAMPTPGLPVRLGCRPRVISTLIRLTLPRTSFARSGRAKLTRTFRRGSKCGAHGAVTGLSKWNPDPMWGEGVGLSRLATNPRNSRCLDRHSYRGRSPDPSGLSPSFGGKHRSESDQGIDANLKARTTLWVSGTSRRGAICHCPSLIWCPGQPRAHC